MNQQNKSRLAQEAQKTDFWQQVFVPMYQELHDNLETLAYNSEDVWARGRFIEGVKALRTLMIQINDLAAESKPRPFDAAIDVNTLDSGHLED